MLGLKVLVSLVVAASAVEEVADHHHHHHHGHHHHRAPAQADQADSTRSNHTAAVAVAAAAPVSDDQILMKMKKVEKELDESEHKAQTRSVKGHLDVNGPLPADFALRFSQSVALATGGKPTDVELLGAVPVPSAGSKVEEIVFQGSPEIVSAIEEQASNPDSKLAKGSLRPMLVADDEDGGDDSSVSMGAGTPESTEAAESAEPREGAAPEVDMAMPYGDLEPFGRENTAQELTSNSISESNLMVDQLERAEVAEEKRAVFRALTRLRGAAITSYDGIARAQTGNIDEYARKNQWRKAHPVRHLAQEEADVQKWAFPESSE